VLVDDESILPNQQDLVTGPDDDADRTIGKVDGVVRSRGTVGVRDLLQQHAEPRISRQWTERGPRYGCA